MAARIIESGHEVTGIGVECGGQGASFERRAYLLCMFNRETCIASEHANAGNDEEYERKDAWAKERSD